MIEFTKDECRILHRDLETPPIPALLKAVAMIKAAFPGAKVIDRERIADAPPPRA